ncbi:MAG: hypothetical protein RL091_770, partial [Verrucomicrobiota bacterium]
MSEERVKEVLTVRERPVGWVEGKWGSSLVAVERGSFPVSQTGYRSLSGLRGKPTPEFLEALAKERDQERKEILARSREPVRPEAESLRNFIHVNSTAEKAFHDGFFATDAERAKLWSAAFKLFSLIDTDARYQPTQDIRWSQDSCTRALARTRETLQFLKVCASGDFPKKIPFKTPWLQIVPTSYFQLPPKPGGEPVVALPAVTASLSMDLTTAGMSRPVSPVKRKTEAPRPVIVRQETQLGLFGAEPA